MPEGEEERKKERKGKAACCTSYDGVSLVSAGNGHKNVFTAK
jgi:hypothetical protein